MSFWLVRFQRESTSMETRALVEADSAARAKAYALEEWDAPFVSPQDGGVYPVHPVDRVVVEPSSNEGRVLRWWEEPA
jgi:hypothetical protein